ncbi:class I SAM-dependent methyltransferase [Christiangramia sp.]|uniref:class I SAM-dependent methyltransferase n=1 Tax=Christiangramia sp. TaxID=1931228 RepID=UPI0032423430
MSVENDKNQEKNRLFYENLYKDYPVSNIIHWVNDLDVFLKASLTTEASWFALYQGDLQNRLKGKKVLEMGCGNCVNASIMAALGAEVYANDIASSSGEIIKKVNEKITFKYPIKFIQGDFLENKLSSGMFDYVIGKAFLHHLRIPEERLFLKETARLLKDDGEARFFEPAVNNRILDEIRWHIPIKGRPSKFNRKAFKKWREIDPHPERSFSSRHFKKAGEEFFGEVKIMPVGTLERFSKFMSWGKKREKFKSWALNNEKKIPFFINKNLTRSQLIIYKNARAEKLGID